MDHAILWVVSLITIVCLIAWGIFLLWAQIIVNIALLLFGALALGGVQL